MRIGKHTPCAHLCLHTHTQRKRHSRGSHRLSESNPWIGSSSVKWLGYWVSLRRPFSPPRGIAGVCVTVGRLCLDTSLGQGPAHQQSSRAPCGPQYSVSAPSNNRFEGSRNLAATSSSREQPAARTSVLTPFATPNSMSRWSVDGNMGILIHMHHYCHDCICHNITTRCRFMTRRVPLKVPLGAFDHITLSSEMQMFNFVSFFPNTFYEHTISHTSDPEVK